MGREGQPPIPASAGGDSHHLLYDQRSVQLPEAAACHHLCDSGFLYRGISYFLLVPAELRPGRFASFVLLCGITVNASIYVLNEYNSIRRRFPRLSALRAYVKAWNAKVVPIFLTVVSTILGFIPFMIGEDKEAFWFPLAAGTIGGLVMSVIGIFFFLPVFVLKQRDFLRK